jgi:hypothetical protein
MSSSSGVHSESQEGSGQVSGDGCDQLCVDFGSALDRLESGMTLKLKPGVHVLARPYLNDTRGLLNVSINGSGVSDTVITCNKKLGLAFIGIENLLFSDLTITGCGLTGGNLGFSMALLEQSLDVFIMVPQTTHIALFLGDCKDLSMLNVHITNTTGLGLLGINIMGSSLLSGVNFTRNIRPQCFDIPAFITLSQTDFPHFYNQVGGGAYFLYSDYSDVHQSTSVSLHLANCYFAHNADCTFASAISINFAFYSANRQPLYNHAVGAGGGLSVVLAQSGFETSVAVTHSTFYQNDARYGGGAYVATFAGFHHPNAVNFVNCEFLENGVASSDSSAGLWDVQCSGGAGLAVYTDLVKPEHFKNSIPAAGENVVTVGVFGSRFIRNEAHSQGGGVMAYSLFTTPHSTHGVFDRGFHYIKWLIFNATFTENFAGCGSALYLKQSVDFGVSGSVLASLQDLDVSRNFNERGQDSNFLSGSEKASAFHLSGVTCNVHGSSSFSENRGSAIRVESTLLVLLNSALITFHENLAHRGGALYFTGNTPAILSFPNAGLTFNNNHAVIAGGAIYFDPYGTPFDILQPLSNLGCFIYTVEAFNFLTSNISLSFTNNTAPLGGIVFGSSLELCPWAKSIERGTNSFYEVLAGYNSTFKFSEMPRGENMVSTLPTNINASILSNSSEPTVTVFPGEVIPVQIEVFDEYGNTIPEVVTSRVNNHTISAQSTLGSSGFWHTSVNQSELQVTGMYEGLVNVSIVTETTSSSVTFSVNLTQCPTGFFIDPDTEQCTCNATLLNTPGIHCLENSVSFNVIDGYWVGIDTSISDPNSGDLIVRPCIISYCRSGSKTVSPADFDSQCRHSRAGLLCGKCAEGLSVVFGTNECLVCSNYSLFLIPVFALAGAVLFAGIALLEVTIDKGLTNAVIFFPNLLSCFEFLAPNLPVFLPFRLLALQLGVNTCFFSGMTALHRSYILFALPLYLSILMVIFIFLCRRFTWMSQNFKPAKTLATLMVMCYLSVFTTTLDIIVPVRVMTLGDEVSHRWMMDPTQRYFEGSHGFLAAIACILLVFYVILLPLFLLFPTLAYRHLKRFSPFLDIIWGAYKPKLRFWFGIRVLVVAILYATTRAPQFYAFTVSGVIIVVFSNIQAVLRPLKDGKANNIDSVLTILAVIYFWCVQGFSTADDFTIPIQVLAILSVILFSLVSYFIYCLAFILHINWRFPSLRPTLALKMKTVLKKSKSEKKVVVEVNLNTDEEEVNFGSRASQSSIHLRVHPSPARAPQYRESLLGST